MLIFCSFQDFFPCLQNFQDNETFVIDCTLNVHGISSWSFTSRHPLHRRQSDVLVDCLCVELACCWINIIRRQNCSRQTSCLFLWETTSAMTKRLKFNGSSLTTGGCCLTSTHIQSWELRFVTFCWQSDNEKHAVRSVVQCSWVFSCLWLKVWPGQFFLFLVLFPSLWFN